MKCIQEVAFNVQCTIFFHSRNTQSHQLRFVLFLLPIPFFVGVSFFSFFSAFVASIPHLPLFPFNVQFITLYHLLNSNLFNFFAPWNPSISFTLILAYTIHPFGLQALFNVWNYIVVPFILCRPNEIGGKSQHLLFVVFSKSLLIVLRLIFLRIIS